jgi:hypothetical protein
MVRWNSWKDSKGRPAFAIPVSRGSDDAEVTALDRMSMAEWLDARGFNSQRLRWYVEYACRDDYGATLEQTSAWAGVFYFTSRVGGEEVDSQPFITWPEGNGRIVKHLVTRAGDRLSSGAAVVDVRPTQDGVDVVALDLKSDRAMGFHARRVIFATPRFMVPRMIAGLRESPPPWLGEFEYGSWTVANLHLSDRPLTPALSFPPCWDNVLYESPSLGYISATHQALKDYGPTVFTWYYPIVEQDVREARTKLLSASRGEWAEVALSDLEIAHRDIRQLVDRIDVVRWGHAMVRPKPGLIWGGALQKAVEPYRGIHFAHTDLSGLALFEEALHHGVRAADEVLEAVRV